MEQINFNFIILKNMRSGVAITKKGLENINGYCDKHLLTTSEFAKEIDVKPCTVFVFLKTKRTSRKTAKKMLELKINVQEK